MGFFIKNVRVMGFIDMPGLGDAVRLILLGTFLCVIEALILAGFIYMIIKKYPIKKIFAVGGIFLFLIAVYFINWTPFVAEDLSSIIGPTTPTLYSFLRIFGVAALVTVVWLHGIKDKILRWIIWVWTAIVGFVNVSWGIIVFVLLQIYPKEYEFFDQVIKHYDNLYHFEIVFLSKINPILTYVLLAIFIAVPIYKLIKHIWQKTGGKHD